MLQYHEHWWSSPFCSCRVVHSIAINESSKWSPTHQSAMAILREPSSIKEAPGIRTYVVNTEVTPKSSDRTRSSCRAESLTTHPSFFSNLYWSHKWPSLTDVQKSERISCLRKMNQNLLSKSESRISQHCCSKGHVERILTNQDVSELYIKLEK